MKTFPHYPLFQKETIKSTLERKLFSKDYFEKEFIIYTYIDEENNKIEIVSYLDDDKEEKRISFNNKNIIEQIKEQEEEKKRIGIEHNCFLSDLYRSVMIYTDFNQTIKRSKQQVWNNVLYLRHFMKKWEIEAPVDFKASIKWIANRHGWRVHNLKLEQNEIICSDKEDAIFKDENGYYKIINNKFPNHMFSIKTHMIEREGKNTEIIFFLPHKDAKEYRFFINNDEELNKKLLDKCKTLYFPIEQLEEAKKGLEEQINFLLENPNWQKPKDVEWIDIHHIKCPNCDKKVYIGENNIDEVFDYDFVNTCENCKYDFSNEIKDVTHIGKNYEYGYFYRVRDKYKYEKRVAKEEELLLQENNYFCEKCVSLTFIGEEIRKHRKNFRLKQTDFLHKKLSNKLISSIEKGKKYSLSSLLKYIKELNLGFFVQNKEKEFLIKEEKDIYNVFEYFNISERKELLENCNPHQFFYILKKTKLEPLVKELF